LTWGETATRKPNVNHIAARDETDEEFDAFEMIKVEGEPLSETIVRERR